MGDRNEVNFRNPLPQISTFLEHQQLELVTLVCFFLLLPFLCVLCVLCVLRGEC